MVHGAPNANRDLENETRRGFLRAGHPPAPLLKRGALLVHAECVPSHRRHWADRTETAVLGRDIPDRPSKVVESNHPLVITGGISGGALPLPLPIPTQPETVSSAISETAVSTSFVMNTTPTTEGPLCVIRG
jgi:hypothetical protein